MRIGIPTPIKRAAPKHAISLQLMETLIPTTRDTKPPRTPSIETTIPKTDKKDENPIKFNPKPNFVNLILSTEDLSISILFASVKPLPPCPPAGWTAWVC